MHRPAVSLRTLVLLTAEFPYGLHETFLETELPYLAAAFDEVVVVPGKVGGARRPVPSNVSVEDGLGEANRRRVRLSAGLSAVRSKSFWSEVSGRPRTLVEPAALRRLVGFSAAAERTRRWLRGWLSRSEVDPAATLFYSYWLVPESAGMVQLRAGHPGLRTVSRAHGYDVYAERADPPYIPLQRFVLPRLDGVFCVSDHGADYLRDRFPHTSARVHVARLGVEDPEWTTPPSTDGIFRVVSCSNLNRVKRVTLLVRALGALAVRRPELRVRWDHFGDGDQRESVEAAALVLPERIRWTLHGRIPNREVLDWYRSSPVDTVANVSASEGVPVSIMEAQSFGVPAVATGVGGTPEIVNDRSGVPLGPDPSPEEIARALERLLPGAPDVANLRQGAKRHWAENFDAGRNYPAFARELRTVGTWG